MTKQLRVSGVILLLASLLYAAIYAFIVMVALITSGKGLVTQPWAWYAALVPIMYSLFCAYTVLATGKFQIKIILFIGIALGAIAIPSTYTSFLGYGKYLPVLMVLWLVYYFFLFRSPYNKALQPDA